MSFAGEVKQELCRSPLTQRCCARAEIYGILLYCNTFTAEEIRVVTESDALLSRLPALLQKAFGVQVQTAPKGAGKRSFLLRDTQLLRMLRETFGVERAAVAHHINFAVLEESCCRGAFLRGAFLAGGAVTDPRKDYHLELATSHYFVSREIPALMREEGFSPKSARRGSNYLTYFKRSDAIEDFLTRIGAPLSAMELMNAKLEKSLRSGVNRRVNCDAANLDKVVEAAQTQLAAIRRLAGRGLLDGLDSRLREAARLRMENPEDTLSQLAQRCQPPATRSALNHRLRKLVELGRTLEGAPEG